MWCDESSGRRHDSAYVRFFILLHKAKFKNLNLSGLDARAGMFAVVTRIFTHEEQVADLVALPLNLLVS